jgi:hypothetical protein
MNNATEQNDLRELETTAGKIVQRHKELVNRCIALGDAFVKAKQEASTAYKRGMLAGVAMGLVIGFLIGFGA